MAKPKRKPAEEVRQSYRYTGVNPLPIIGSEHIAAVLGLRKSFVREWYKAGAPIWFNGNAYVTEFTALLYWLLQYELRDKDGGPEKDQHEEPMEK